MFRLALSILILSLFSLTAVADNEFQAKYVEVNLQILAPDQEVFTPTLTLKVGHQATVRRTGENGDGLRLDVIAPRLFVDQKGRPVVELNWTLYRVSESETSVLSETQTAVVAGADMATFRTETQDKKSVVAVDLNTRIVPDGELKEKFGSTEPDVEACDEKAAALADPAKGRGECCTAPCGVGQTLTCCGAVYCCCAPGWCCYPP